MKHILIAFMCMTFSTLAFADSAAPSPESKLMQAMLNAGVSQYTNTLQENVVDTGFIIQNLICRRADGAQYDDCSMIDPTSKKAIFLDKDSKAGPALAQALVDALKNIKGSEGYKHTMEHANMDQTVVSLNIGSVICSSDTQNGQPSPQYPTTCVFDAFGNGN